MTDTHSQPDDPDDDPDDVGGFRFPMADGGSDDSRERTDGSGETNRGFPTMPDGTEQSDGGRALADAGFGGFDFGTWLEETEARAPTTPTETTSTEAVAEDVDAERDVAQAFGGFSFRQWMESDDATGPREPPKTARVVTQSIAEVDPEAAATSASVVNYASTGDAHPGGFAFADWLGQGDTEFIDADAITSEPEPEPSTPAVGATVPGEPGYPSLPGGGISDLPPVKVAVFAVFAATLAAVALTVAGPVAPLGPATGFADPAPAQTAPPAATATPTPTATDTPEPPDTPTATDQPGTPTATDQPDTPTPSATPTPPPTPTPTASPTATQTEPPTPTSTDDGNIIDDIIGG